MESINCFAFSHDVCLALNKVKVPEECKNCHFRKPSRDVTNGKTYALDLIGYPYDHMGRKHEYM